MGLIAAIFLIVFIIALVRMRISIDWGSILRPTLPLARGVFGVYCFTGKQGAGKTYSVNKFIRKHHQDKKIYSNLTFQDLEYEKLESVTELLALKDQSNCIIIYDEIFTLMQKSSRIEAEMMEFLTQQRKQQNIFITTAQEWLELPITFRRFVRIQIECTTKPLGRFGGILFESYYDAYQMKWSQIDNEYIAPLISKKISKYEKRFMITYDTFERISKLK